MFENKALSLSRAGECMAGEDLAAAEDYLQRALNLDPRIPAALVKMAEIRFLQENYMGAAGLYRTPHRGDSA